MIKAIFFDLYNTLMTFQPPREQLQLQALAEMGLGADPVLLARGYPGADRFWAQENGRWPLDRRPQAERERFYAAYEARILRVAGLEVSPETALRLFQRVREESRWALFDDVLPTLTALRQRGLTLGVVTNLSDNLQASLDSLGLAGLVHFVVSAAEAGDTKPDPVIFQAALKRAGVQPQEALHVGDQYDSDVLGALAAGITPLLLDREGDSPWTDDVAVLGSLSEVLHFIEG